jgi:phage host-nuclease inhibitor protein Gam
MSKRKKSAAPFVVIQTEDGLAAAANRFVEASLELAMKKAAHEQRLAELNAAFDRETAELVAEVEGLVNSSQLYCQTHRELFPDDKRSREYRNARVGFRWNPVKVDKLLAKDTWEAIGERLELLPWGQPYISYRSPDVNKELLREHQANLTEEQLAEAGIRFAKGETFFIEPSFDAVPRVTKEAA